MSSSNELPVAVIGAGPIGLAAAAELVGRGLPVVVLEQGTQVAAGVRSWGYVRLFSPWSELVSPAATGLLQETGWQMPEVDQYPTGAEWVRDYLAPLGELLGDRVLPGSRVVGVAKLDRDLLVDSGRDDQPFAVHVQSQDGSVERRLARAVIDASGTLNLPNPLEAEGYPVAGEAVHSARVRYGMPDPAVDEHVYSGKATVVVGSGASALTALIALTSKPLHTARSRVVWVLRRGGVGNSYGGSEADELPARGVLGTTVRQAVDAGVIEVVTGFRTAAIEDSGNGRVALLGTEGRRIDGVDRVVGATGFRPDLSFLSEVLLDLDPRLQAPSRLAPEIDPNFHSCGSVTPHGHDVLAQPEKGLYLAGMKSYGRAPSFLAMTGFEQVRSIGAALVGDLDAANTVELRLPDTGVCGGAGLFDAEITDGGCCGAAAGPQPISIGVSAR